MATAKVNIKEAAQKVVLTVKVKRMREYRFRLAVASFLVRLAGKIAWFKVRIEDV